MKSNKDIRKIKESFDSQEFKAPAFDFKELDDHNLDQKVKSSFEKQTITAPVFDFDQLDAAKIDSVVKQSFDQVVIAAPGDGWDKIQDKMTVDHVWDRLAPTIKVKSTSWRRYAAAAIAILSISLVPQITKDSELCQNLSEGNEFALVETVEVLSNEDSIVEEANLYADNNVTNYNQGNYSEIRVIEMPVELNQHSIREEMVIDQDAQKYDFTAVKKISNVLNAPLIPSIDLNPIKKESQRSFSLGIIGAANRTWIRDNETRNALEKNTISSSKLSLGGYYGLQAEFGFNDNWATQLSFMKGTTTNKLGVYKQGFYQEKISEISYLKLALTASYSANFITKSVPWAIKTKLGPSYSFINSSYTVQGETLTSLNDLFVKHNIGVLAQIGPEFKFNRFIIEAGVNFEQGLLNIYDGNGQIPSDLNYTSNREIGVFTSIRYRLK
ncbi:MAG: hypothetical protein ACI857_001583 [Arenicella sp.]